MITIIITGVVCFVAGVICTFAYIGVTSMLGGGMEPYE
jgi:hypothetical protein